MRTCIRNRTPGGLYFFTVNLAERHGNTLLTDKIDFGGTPQTTPSAFGVHPSTEGNFYAHATPIPLHGGVARSAGVVTASPGDCCFVFEHDTATLGPSTQPMAKGYEVLNA